MKRFLATSKRYVHTCKALSERPVMEFKEVVEDRYSCKKFNGEPDALARASKRVVLNGVQVANSPARE